MLPTRVRKDLKPSQISEGFLEELVSEVDANSEFAGFGLADDV